MSDVEFRSVNQRFNITRGAHDHHNDHRDPAFTGRYLRRLPDHSMVYADEYEDRLKEYEASRKREGRAEADEE